MLWTDLQSHILPGFDDGAADDWRFLEMAQVAVKGANRDFIRVVAADGQHLFLISGNGDVIEPDENVIAIGSGGVPAQAAATALMRHADMEAVEVAREAMKITAALCVFTNDQLTLEEMAFDAES